MIPSQRKEIIKNINQQLGLSIDTNTPGNAKISSVLYNASTQKVESYVKQFSTFIPLLVSVGFFFSLKTVSVIFGYVAIMFVALLFKLLLRAGILKIEKVPAKQEQIV